MKKGLSIFVTILGISALSYADNTAVSIQKVEGIENIETEYQQLLLQETAKREELSVEKTKLEHELVSLKEKAIGKEKFLEKLQKDAEIRWHRKEYKKLLNNYETYYQKLEIKIADTEQKNIELANLLEIMK